MAKGQVSKAQITNKLLEIFDGAFLYNDGKEIRIPMIEDGNEVQIKVALTCAKDNVIPGADNALPGSVAAQPKADNTVYTFGNTMTATVTENKEVKPVVEPTAEERANVKSLLEALGL